MWISWPLGGSDVDFIPLGGRDVDACLLGGRDEESCMLGGSDVDSCTLGIVLLLKCPQKPPINLSHGSVHAL
jgi:hypothetical protein